MIQRLLYLDLPPRLPWSDLPPLPAWPLPPPPFRRSSVYMSGFESRIAGMVIESRIRVELEAGVETERGD
jgi:hypothetical protein